LRTLCRSNLCSFLSTVWTCLYITNCIFTSADTSSPQRTLILCLTYNVDIVSRKTCDRPSIPRGTISPQTRRFILKSVTWCNVGKDFVFYESYPTYTQWHYIALPTRDIAVSCLGQTTMSKEHSAVCLDIISYGEGMRKPEIRMNKHIPTIKTCCIDE
jgi:hypothetical protein